MKKAVVFLLSAAVLIAAGVLSFTYYKHNHDRKSAEKTVMAFIDASNEQNIKVVLERHRNLIFTISMRHCERTSILCRQHTLSA